MSTLDEAIVAQEDIASLYVSSRKEKLETLWNEFQRIHTTLKEDPKSDYFKTIIITR